jgi:hypothetical protein
MDQLKKIAEVILRKKDSTSKRQRTNVESYAPVEDKGEYKQTWYYNPNEEKLSEADLVALSPRSSLPLSRSRTKLTIYLKDDEQYREFLALQFNDVKGWGLFARTKIHKDDYISTYEGIVVEKSMQTPEMRKHSIQTSKSTDMYADPKLLYHLAHFINEPLKSEGKNAYNVSIKRDMEVLATKNIEKGAELLFDYGNTYEREYDTPLHNKNMAMVPFHEVQPHGALHQKPADQKEFIAKGQTRAMKEPIYCKECGLENIDSQEEGGFMECPCGELLNTHDITRINCRICKEPLGLRSVRMHMTNNHMGISETGAKLYLKYQSERQRYPIKYTDGIFGRYDKDDEQTEESVKRFINFNLKKSTIPNAGVGIFAAADIPAQSLIGIFGGEVISATNNIVFQPEYNMNIGYGSFRFLLKDAFKTMQAADSKKSLIEYASTNEYDAVGGPDLDPIERLITPTIAQVEIHKQLVIDFLSLPPSVDDAPILESAILENMNWSALLNDAKSPFKNNVVIIRNGFLQTTRDILKGEELFLEYGANYWIGKDTEENLPAYVPKHILDSIMKHEYVLYRDLFQPENSPHLPETFSSSS